MFVRIALLATAVLLSIGATPAAGQVQPVPRDDSEAETRRFRTESLRGAQEVLARWSAAWAHKDARAAAALHGEGGRLLLPGERLPAEGTRAIQQALTEHLAQAGPLALSLVDAEAGGSLVYMYGRYYYAPEPGASEDSSPPNTGSYMAVLQQRGRGWRIRALLFLAEPTEEAAATLP